MNARLLSVCGLILCLGQSLYGLGVIPARQEVRLPPGGTAQGQWEIYNETEHPMEVEASVKDWFVLEENQGITADDWLIIKGKRRWKLKPGERRIVRCQVKAPARAQGVLVGMTSFLSRSPSRTGVDLVMSVSSYVRIEGTERIQGEVTQVFLRPTTRPPIQWEALVTVKNTGNVHLRPTGTVILADSKSQSVTTIKLEEAGPVYPGREESYVGYTAPVQLPPGRYQLQANMHWWDQQATKTAILEVDRTGQMTIQQDAE